MVEINPKYKNKKYTVLSNFSYLKEIIDVYCLKRGKNWCVIHSYSTLYES